MEGQKQHKVNSSNIYYLKKKFCLYLLIQRFDKIDNVTWDQFCGKGVSQVWQKRVFNIYICLFSN